jgi:hypothetical protein
MGRSPSTPRSRKSYLPPHNRLARAQDRVLALLDIAQQLDRRLVALLHVLADVALQAFSRAASCGSLAFRRSVGRSSSFITTTYSSSRLTNATSGSISRVETGCGAGPAVGPAAGWPPPPACTSLPACGRAAPARACLSSAAAPDGGPQSLAQAPTPRICSSQPHREPPSSSSSLCSASICRNRHSRRSRAPTPTGSSSATTARALRQ